MPIYEFYCEPCHTVYSFRTTFDNKRKPKCPDCGHKKLEKQISRFAISKGQAERGEDGLPEVDDAALEKAMMSLEGEAASINEDDPQAMAGFMRKMFDATGMQLGSHMEEAIRRMEAGEDPDKVEEEMGDLLDNDANMFSLKESGQRVQLSEIQKRVRPPKVDSNLYDL